MKQKEYEEIISFIKSNKCKKLNELINQVKDKFEAKFSYQTLVSICLIHHQNHVKRTIHDKSTDASVEKYYSTFLQSKIDGKSHKNSTLVEIATENDIPPLLLARLILHRHLKLKAEESNHVETAEKVNFKTEVARLVKDPFLIEDKVLSWEVRQCILHDFGYGQVTDSVRSLIGSEYEHKLVTHVKELNIPFQTEVDLKKLGFDKTPDIKLEIPFKLKDQVVCWIESKASFGTPEEHMYYVNKQYNSYWNRFGPGLVIYWFGFVDELALDMLKKNILVMDRFPLPAEVSFYNPAFVVKDDKLS
ncbi:CDAN1-interacting nuclease 1 [Ciona intestinalis]